MFGTILKSAAEGATQTQQQNPMDSSMNFMMIFNIFIGIYLLYYAIKGTGKVYENDYPQEMKEEHSKILRKFCWVAGAGLLVLSILEYIFGMNSPWSIVSIVYVLGCIAGYFILFRVKFKDYLQKSKPPKKQKK